jgi:hypothetical protein
MKPFVGGVVIVLAFMSWQPNGHATQLVATEVEGQPLTRATCDKAGLWWDDNANVCDWRPKERLASELITGAIASSQPLTRATCDKAGLAWDDNGNVCDWRSTESTAESSPTIEIASNPRRATKQGTQVTGHTKRKSAHRPPRQTQVVERRPFPLFRLFRD